MVLSEILVGLVGLLMLLLALRHIAALINQLITKLLKAIFAGTIVALFIVTMQAIA